MTTPKAISEDSYLEGSVDCVGGTYDYVEAVSNVIVNKSESKAIGDTLRGTAETRSVEVPTPKAIPEDVALYGSVDGVGDTSGCVEAISIGIVNKSEIEAKGTPPVTPRSRRLVAAAGAVALDTPPKHHPAVGLHFATKGGASIAALTGAC